jgi:acetaldehyde dehydrogenase / alcohol dehydrogenase
MVITANLVLDRERAETSSPTILDELSKRAHPVFAPSFSQNAPLSMDRKLELPETLLAPPEHTAVNSMVERAVRAQKAFQDWPEEQIDQLLQALAEKVSLHAEELAIAAVQETGLGNIADKTAKNRFASLDVYRSLVGQVGHGRLSSDKYRKVTAFASPVGVVFGLVPATNPTSTLRHWATSW